MSSLLEKATSIAVLLLITGCSQREPATNPDAATEKLRRQGLLLTGRGVLFLQQGRPQRALAALEEAVEKIPAMAEPHFNMGLAYGSLGRHAEAIAALERALELGPPSAELYLALGSSLRAQRRDREAANLFARALELAPERPEYHYFRGEALRASADFTGALAAFEEVVHLDSSHV